MTLILFIFREKNKIVLEPNFMLMIIIIIKIIIIPSWHINTGLASSRE